MLSGGLCNWLIEHAYDGEVTDNVRANTPENQRMEWSLDSAKVTDWEQEDGRFTVFLQTEGRYTEQIAPSNRYHPAAYETHYAPVSVSVSWHDGEVVLYAE